MPRQEHPPRMVAHDYTIQPLVSGVAPTKLDRTPEGFRIFNTIFLSSMSQELRHFFQTLPQGQLKPNNDEERMAFDTIYHGLIQRLASDPDLSTSSATSASLAMASKR